MSSSARGPRYWFGVWWPVGLGIVVIAIESQVFMGADHTSRFLRPIWQAVFGHVTDASWEIIHHHIRKSGHFVGYGLVGLAWLRAWWITLEHSKFLTGALLALLGTALTASCDEWHQAFLPNRTSSVWDVLLDCSGALLMMTLVYVYARFSPTQRLAGAAR